jgi:4-hydroxy-tetrahydrodipicolinate reductase
MGDRVRVVHVGLGPIGLGIVEEVLSRPDLELCAAVDVDPAKIGADVGALLGRAPVGVVVDGDIDAAFTRADPDVAVLTTTSSLAALERTLLALFAHQLPVVSTCEELVYPWRAQPRLAARLHAAAEEAGVAVLGTGVNPGFLMDYLPLVVTGACCEVSRVEVERFQDPSRRRVPFQRKVGVGLSVEEFHAKVREGALRHVGLTESVDMIGRSLGFALDTTHESIDPVIATERIERGDVVVEPGQVLGVEQLGRGLSGGIERVRLHFRAAFGERNPIDRIRIEGRPPLEVVIPGGVHGDVATVATTTNAIRRVLHARPGLRTMADMEPLLSRATP